MTVAALYIDGGGPYPRMADVDAWDAVRDARCYPGPWPVVAHPPCGPWSRLRHLYRGDEHNCAPRAVEQVRAFGGVLEHPAESKLWEACGLPLPGEPSCGCYDRRAPEHSCVARIAAGYTIELEQVEWGHIARKRTWLYLVGVPREALEAPPYPGREPTHWISGGRGCAGKKAKTTPVPAGIKVASAAQRRRTPKAFAEYLIRLARAAGEARRAA